MTEGEEVGVMLGVTVGVTEGVAVMLPVGLGVGVRVGVTVGVGVILPVGVTVGVGVGVGVGPPAQPARVMSFVSIVTAALRASALPSMRAPDTSVIDSSARMVPLKREPAAMVAELPIFQKTLQKLPPLTMLTLLPTAVTRVDAVWKIQTAAGSPCASSVSVPVIPKVPEADV